MSHCKGHKTASVAFLPKMHNLTLIMKKNIKKKKLKDILKKN